LYDTDAANAVVSSEAALPLLSLLDRVGFEFLTQHAPDHLLDVSVMRRDEAP